MESTVERSRTSPTGYSERNRCDAEPRSGRRHRALLLNLANHPARVPRGEHASRDSARHDAAGANDRARSDANTGKDDSASTNPDIGADVDRLAELFTPALLGIERMHRRVDLHGWP